MSARCVRPDCDLPAAFRLAANFGDRIGWLCDMEHDPNPHDYLLCARHADTLTLPTNWEMHDQRSPRLAPVPAPEPAPPEPRPEVEPPDLPPAEPVVAHHTPDVEERPAPAATTFEYDPATEVDESTPLLSRAFRAAVPGDARH